MAAVVSAAAITAALPCILVRALSHTGIVTVTVRVVITAIALTSMGVLPGRRTSFHMTDPHNTAGTIAIAIFMRISTISLAVMGVIPRLRTAFHRTYTDYATGTVTIAACMIIPAVS